MPAPGEHLDLMDGDGTIANVVAQLSNGDPAYRPHTTYALGGIGEAAITSLIAVLREAGRQQDQPDENDWNREIIMCGAAHALAALGGWPSSR